MATATLTATRGEEYNGIQGSKYIGQRKNGSVWVWYPGSDQSYEEMCRLFDKINNR